MKRKIKTLLVLSIVSLSIFGAMDTTAHALNVKPILNDEQIIPVKDIIELRYKVVNGKYYVREYNATKKQWIGEWELIG